ncbi:hypothetical protein KIH41_07145 [Litoribacter ruber]|uniref:hypothetical protein n=1 Tax=Litoribacter ruber TaxID=702568 RepID=UPI001BDACAF3|nr:hypothetical protein [Litoribacter ruber]MBT0811054.1 hypothetical protein [Litoribacter ruber]
MELSQLKQLNQWVREKPAHEYIVPKSSLPKVEVYSDVDANELTKSIETFFKVVGGFGNRINTTGRMIKQPKTGKWITVPGHTIKGTADLVGGLYGLTFHVEVKHKDDRQSPEQVEFQNMVIAAGHSYIIARNFDGFIFNIHRELKKRTNLWK